MGMWLNKIIKKSPGKINGKVSENADNKMPDEFLDGEPEIVPDRLETKMNYKIFILIFGLVVGFQLFVSFQEENLAVDVTNIVSIINPLAAALMSFYVSKRYLGSEVFGKSYFVLGLGLVMMTLGEITYTIYYYMDIDPYPSVADVFFFAFYPMAFYHIITNIKFFQPKLDVPTKVIITLVPTLIVGIYSYTSFLNLGEANLDYFLGLAFITASAVVLSAGILGARVFRQGVLGVAWLVLVIGIVLTTIGDIWYYYMGDDAYSLLHPVNLFWYASYMVITYALYKHQDTF